MPKNLHPRMSADGGFIFLMACFVIQKPIIKSESVQILYAIIVLFSALFRR